jgi:hypothetical protein
MKFIYLVKMEGESEGDNVDGGRLIGAYTTLEQAKAEAERIGDIFKDMVEIAETYESLNQEEALSEFIQQTELNYWVDYPVVSIKGLPLDENLYSNYFNSFEEEE